MKIRNELFRTDLAIEEHEEHGCDGHVTGVKFQERIERNTNIHIDIVDIETEEGAAVLGKPVGTYVTLSGGTIGGHTDEEVQASAVVLGKALERVLPKGWKSIFVVGLGNASMTADALGPATVEKLLVNRCIKSISEHKLCAIAPGVMGQTGMETLEVVRGVVSEVKPDAVVVVDALAARAVSRLLATIQLSDTGICPGSGVANHRMELSEKTLGIPVICVGIPTVIGAATLVYDSLPEKTEDYPNSSLMENLCNMHVTPKDIDVHIKELSTLIAEGIHHVIYTE